MNRIIFLLLAAAVLNGCSAPKSPEPKGEWMPVNRVPAQSGNAQ
ncbi:membrane lipoprotein lipid attachment site-containing protein [Trinickia dabaoshanensis]|nr:membrane lipoprotein lipid attachment site-containing protein [Trinickia dabaoshanensis]